TPVAAASAPDVTIAGGTSQLITVKYTDDLGIDVSSLGNGDIIVNGPSGQIPVTFQGVDINSNGTPRTATYQMIPPGGSWTNGEGGLYTIAVVANEVFDSDSPTPHAVPAGTVGTFKVSLPTTYIVD